MGEWISLNEYSKRYHMHHDQVKRLIANGRIECEMTKGGYYKIWVSGEKDTKREEELIKENSELRATIKNLQSILAQVNI